MLNTEKRRRAVVEPVSPNTLAIRARKQTHNVVTNSQYNNINNNDKNNNNNNNNNT